MVRDDDNAIIDPSASILEDYVNRAPLVGDAFDADSSEVHTYIVNFTAGNEMAESKLLAIADQSNGRLDFKVLQDHYEGVGINDIAIREADNIIATLEYTGERRPTMWWDEFEKKLTMAFVTYDKREKRQVHSNEMKLRILCQKVNADFLHTTRQIINIGLTRTPVTMTYEQALASFRNEATESFPLTSPLSLKHVEWQKLMPSFIVAVDAAMAEEGWVVVVEDEGEELEGLTIPEKIHALSLVLML